ncbi:MAG: BrnA antitoxin family protein [Acidobacteria bacterium]|nr:BrnA antitoxin family protein [Acidobacteriota bacterium]
MPISTTLIFRHFQTSSSRSSNAPPRNWYKKLVAVRLDADVFEWIRQFGAGYSTRINSVLRVVMSQQR